MCTQVHAAIDAEVARLGGDASRVAIGGASQGGCTAIDAALTYRARLAGVVASHAQLYSCTPVPSRRSGLSIHTFNGAADRCIAASLALRSYSGLIDAGFYALRIHVEPALTHCEHSEAEMRWLTEALLTFGVRTDGPAASEPALGAVGEEDAEAHVSGVEERPEAQPEMQPEMQPLADAMSTLSLLRVGEAAALPVFA